MKQEFSRSALLLDDIGIDRLAESTVAIFGIGGVGGHVVEALARCGVGRFVLVDNDQVSITNINRQIVATTKTVGMDKVAVMKDRILEINPDAHVEIHKCFFLPENADEFDFASYTYVVDAVDTVTAKLAIIKKAKEAKVPVISSMGTGNKLDPTRFEVADIYDTSVCPLARVMRTECKKRGIKELKVVYSKEEAMKPKGEINEKIPDGKRAIPGSVSFVPSVAGLIIAGEVIKDIAK